MGSGPRITQQTRDVLGELLCRPDEPRYGRELAEAVGWKGGTVQPILQRLENAGWLCSFWEDSAVHEKEGRPRRRYYQLTAEGIGQAQRATAQTVPSLTPPFVRGREACS